MSSDMKIGAPFTLASLPRPTTNTAGRTQAQAVSSISGAKKRKRSELAVAVDGEGILIYSLQNPQLVTSYALPPQTSFATAPCSLYRKGASKRSAVRFTYAAATRDVPGDKPQIICFTEEVHKDGTADTVKTAHTVTRPADDVIAIESISLPSGSGKSDSHDVLVVFASGHVMCLSSTLETVRWDAELGKLGPQAKGQTVLKTEYVSVTTAKAAIAGLLRSRQDIAAILDPSFEGDAELLGLTPVVCAVFQLPGDRRVLSLFHIQPRSHDSISSRRLPLKHLLTWDLPSAAPKLASVPEAAERLYHLHSSSGIMHQLADSHLLSYDFSGTVPKIYSDFRVPGSNIGSFLRISPDLIFTTTGQSWAIFDVKYGSVQSMLPIEKGAGFTNDSKKRKHADQELAKSSDDSPALISYFAETGLAVGISDHEIIGIQIAETVARKRMKSDNTLLINAIGKGISSGPSAISNGTSVASGTAALSKGAPRKDSPQWQDLERRLSKLDKYSSRGKVAEFERQFAAHLGIELAEPSPAQDTLENETATPLLANGVSESATSSLSVQVSEPAAGETDEELQRWNLTQAITVTQKSCYRHSAMYALRKIFRYVKPETTTKKATRGSPLEVEFFPPNVFQWLLLSGYVTKESIRRSILEDCPDDLDAAAFIADGDIVKAIVEFDPELHILSAVLNHNHFLPIGEVVQAIRVLMQSLDDQPTTDAVSGSMANGTGPSDDAMDVDFATELDAATHDLDHALAVLDNGLITRSHNLRPALIRLHTFPAPVIASTLRSMLPRRELESLIRLLHSEFKTGGWTSPYDFLDSDELPTETTAEAPDDQAVAIIASLLSCALDATGAGAWLASVGPSTSEQSTEDMISELLKDTSEALNGFWEARFMRGLLSEFLRYSSNLTKTKKPTAATLQKQGKPFAEEIATRGELPMLPLGGKADLGVETKKAGKAGKKEERSAREIGMLISKRVPKYSFEKIVL